MGGSWEGGIWDALQPLLLANRATHVERTPALEAFARCESQRQAETPDRLYPELLRVVHGDLAREFELASSPELDVDFGRSVPYWPAFPDSADALRRLKQHYKLVILSNVDREGFAASHRKLGVEFDAIYTAEDVGAYKPDPRNFAYMLDRLERDLGVTAATVLHTAQSLFHDHVPAARAGLARSWIDRQGLKESENWGATAKVPQRPDVHFWYPTMMAMA